MKNKPNKETLEMMSKNLSNWHGPFYFNRKDPRLVVRKIHPQLGWTFNFASSNTYMLILTVIIIIVVVQLLLKF